MRPEFARPRCTKGGIENPAPVPNSAECNNKVQQNSSAMCSRWGNDAFVILAEKSECNNSFQLEIWKVKVVDADPYILFNLWDQIWQVSPTLRTVHAACPAEQLPALVIGNAIRGRPYTEPSSLWDAGCKTFNTQSISKPSKPLKMIFS